MDNRLSDVRFLTADEVAKLLRVSPMTVYRLIEARELGAIKVGRAYRIYEQSVSAYLERQNGNGHNAEEPPA